MIKRDPFITINTSLWYVNVLIIPSQADFVVGPSVTLSIVYFWVIHAIVCATIPFRKVYCPILWTYIRYFERTNHQIIRIKVLIRCPWYWSTAVERLLTDFDDIFSPIILCITYWPFCTTCHDRDCACNLLPWILLIARAVNLKIRRFWCAGVYWDCITS